MGFKIPLMVFFHAFVSFINFGLWRYSLEDNRVICGIDDDVIIDY